MKDIPEYLQAAHEEIERCFLIFFNVMMKNALLFIYVLVALVAILIFFYRG